MTKLNSILIVMALVVGCSSPVVIKQETVKVQDTTEVADASVLDDAVEADAGNAVVEADAGSDATVTKNSVVAKDAGTDSGKAVDASKDVTVTQADADVQEAQEDASEAIQDAGTDTGTDTGVNTDDAATSQGYCGDGIVDPANEDCERPRLLNGETCSSLGYKMGNLFCLSNCQFDTSFCVPMGDAVCGNGYVEEGEVCEGRTGDVTCKDLGFDGNVNMPNKADGLVACANCQYDTSVCYKTVPEHVVCDLDCGPNARCLDGACQCNTGAYGQEFDNCDGDWSNGCETPTDRTYSCGTCGDIQVCSEMEMCGDHKCQVYTNVFEDCNVAHAGGGCVDADTEWCVCSREGHPECCSTGGWTEACAESARTECVDTQESRKTCNEITMNPGCNDAAIVACVVANGGTNCKTLWNVVCVNIAHDLCNDVSAEYWDVY